jgi:hypothetical protein
VVGVHRRAGGELGRGGKPCAAEAGQTCWVFYGGIAAVCCGLSCCVLKCCGVSCHGVGFIGRRFWSGRGYGGVNVRRKPLPSSSNVPRNGDPYDWLPRLLLFLSFA